MLVLLLVGVTMQNAFFITLFSHLQAKLETKALKAKRPGFTDERYNETSYYYDINSSKYIFPVCTFIRYFSLKVSRVAS